MPWQSTTTPSNHETQRKKAHNWLLPYTKEKTTRKASERGIVDCTLSLSKGSVDTSLTRVDTMLQTQDEIMQTGQVVSTLVQVVSTLETAPRTPSSQSGTVCRH
ncbi:hypothetical protein Taro_008389 [Colocasia esculenta]|uniref:Uncharacterized protein n=1 Tax=Colocasia esculenta TaxID=4460 RepID=A0A843U6U2_COLES|nr:hypothetical protein [Colocasia esculenta]